MWAPTTPKRVIWRSGSRRTSGSSTSRRRSPERAPRHEAAPGAGAAIATGTRVFLRPPTSRDRDEFLALNRESARFHRGLASPPTTEEEFDTLVERSRSDDFAGFLICRAQDGAIVGSIAISQIYRGNFWNAYLGYHIAAPHAARGYMSEALQLTLRFAFRDLGLHRIEANIQPGNKASIALVRRAGFTREGYSRRYLKIGGRWRDHERWTLLREDWRPRKA